MTELEQIETRFSQCFTALDQIQFSIQKLEANVVPEYCTLELACKLKGGSNYRNLYTRPWQQPCCGTRYQRVNGRKVWQKADVLRWLQVTDSNLEEYAASLGIDISANFFNGKNKKAAKAAKKEQK